MENFIYSVLGFVIGLIVPPIVVKVKSQLKLAKDKLGDEKYNECKNLLISLAKLHPEDFAENKIVDLLDKLDNKYGDHLTKAQIKEIVDFVVKTIENDVAKEITK